MQIEVQAQDFIESGSLRDYVKRRLGFALNRCDEHIRRVEVRLSDINGPRGGCDKCCRIQIMLPQISDIIIEDTETDIYAAIDKAADRAGRTLTRKLARQRDRERTVNLTEFLSAEEATDLSDTYEETMQ